MIKAFVYGLVAAGLAGCAGSTPTPADTRNDKEAPLPSGQGMFGSAFTWEWRKKEDPAKPAPAAAPAAAAPAPAAAAKPPQAGDAERQEFEEWRAWQEWKRKNPK